VGVDVEYVIAVLGGYLLGSIPFGLLLTRAAGLGDIRSIGSGNIGATNVLRTGNKALALGTLLLDAGKAMLALVLVRHFHGAEAGFVAGAAAFLGHCFPVWLRFKGGKGVATFFGTLLVGLWPVCLIAGVMWLATAFTFRYSSLASLFASALAPLVALVFTQSPIAIGSILAMSALLWVRHYENIQRLRAGAEGKIGQKG
jgi:acyl phosphate:glycerol-3-phosphate acyltransferase